MIRISVGRIVFEARLEETAAPRTCAAFRGLLPYRQKIIQARWSGEACWIPLGSLDLGLGHENHTSYPGPTNEAVEKLRADFVRQPDPAKQKQIAEQIQLIAYDEVPYVSWGQFVVPSGFRKNVQGVLQFGATLLWNISV